MSPITDDDLMNPKVYRVKWGEQPDLDHVLPEPDDMTEQDCDLLRVSLWWEVQKRNRLN